MSSRLKKSFVSLFAAGGFALAALMGNPAMDSQAVLEAGWLDYKDWIIVEWCSGDCHFDTSDCCQTPE